MPERLVEAVNVECAECGLLSNDMTDWEPIQNEEFGFWYYLCPKCARDSQELPQVEGQ